MKWILVTTNPRPFVHNSKHPHGAGWNVGDQFALVGTRQLVREVDPHADIELVNMDVAQDFLRERPFDRAILAGRPMFWPGAPSHPLWIHVLDGWLCRDPRKVLALGVGDCFPLEHPVDEWMAQAAYARNRCWRVISRSSGAPFIDEDVSVCPGAWALLDRAEPQTDDLFNLMVGGAHYPATAAEEARRWGALEREAATVFIAAGFKFVAHTLQEAMLADSLGWPAARILMGRTVSDYLSIYARARRYVGNRMHGAIVLAGRAAASTAIGFDSRLRAVERTGARAMRPSDLDSFRLRALARLEANDAGARIDFVREERARALELVRDFAS